MKNKILTGLFRFCAVLVSVLFFFPIVWMFYSSLKSQNDFATNILGLPKEIVFSNYIQAFSVMKMDVYFFNSLIITLFSVFLVIYFGFTAGYSLARFQFKGRKFFVFAVLIGMLIPVHGLLVPLFIEFNFMRLFDTRMALVLINLGFNLPLAIFLGSGFVKSVPYSLEESALIEGASFFRTLFGIVFPICKPVVSTIIILTFLAAWNEFPFALVMISTTALKTLPIGMANFSGEFSTNYTQLLAGSIISLTPVLIIFIFFSEKIKSALSQGAIKG